MGAAGRVAGAVAGAAMGAAMVGVSSAAATSVASTRFAAGTGLNMTARQLGGALGIATLAAILEAQGPTVDAFRDVFLFCSVTAVVAAVVLYLCMRYVLRFRPAPA